MTSCGSTICAPSIMSGPLSRSGAAPGWGSGWGSLSGAIMVSGGVRSTPGASTGAKSAAAESAKRSASFKTSRLACGRLGVEGTMLGATAGAWTGAGDVSVKLAPCPTSNPATSNAGREIVAVLVSAFGALFCGAISGASEARDTAGACGRLGASSTGTTNSRPSGGRANSDPAGVSTFAASGPGNGVFKDTATITIRLLIAPQMSPARIPLPIFCLCSSKRAVLRLTPVPGSAHLYRDHGAGCTPLRCAV